MKIFLCVMLVFALVLTSVGCGTQQVPNENLSSEVTSVLNSQSSTVSEVEKEIPKRSVILNGEDPELYDLSIANEGNNARIANLMRKAEKGGSYVIGAIGGSITQGAGATAEENRYVNLVYEWWKENFPKATFKLVNAGIGSSNAEMACYRMETDLLSHNPDFVMVDFTVNIYLNNDQSNTYQTVLYKIMNQKNAPGVMSIHFTSTKLEEYNKGNYIKGSEYPIKEIKDAIEKYDVPAMDYHKYVWKRIEDGAIKWTNVGADYIHPGNRGHQIAAAMLCAYLEKVKDNLEKEPTEVPALPKLDTEKFLNLGYVFNTTEGVENVGFKKEPNNSLQTRGWSYTSGTGDASLKVPLPKNKDVVLFMWFGDTEGKITLKGANGVTKTLDITIKTNHVLMPYGAMGDSVTIIPELTKGNMKILGIGIAN